jgi:hypothetical protein
MMPGFSRSLYRGQARFQQVYDCLFAQGFGLEAIRPQWILGHRLFEVNVFVAPNPAVHQGGQLCAIHCPSAGRQPVGSPADSISRISASPSGVQGGAGPGPTRAQSHSPSRPAGR